VSDSFESFKSDYAKLPRRQMRGRAGRKGKDEVGETYLCCQKSDLEAVAELMEADIPIVESCLLPGKRGIKR
jgi:replicative superfamily II helicase